MKTYLQLLLLSSLFMIFSCKGDTTDLKTNSTYKQDDSVTKQVTEPIKKRKFFQFVTAESGLNYRDKPNGNIIGKLEWRTKVEYLFHTEEKQTITDNYREVEGTWVAVRHKRDTVFMFEPYLSYEEPSISRIKLYLAQPYYNSGIVQPSQKKDIRQAFVNVSESFYMPKNFIDQKDLRKDTITLNKKQRTEFLKRMNYSNRDTLFIYDLVSGKVKKHPVKKTPLMACISIYSSIEDEDKTENYHEYNYEIGFNLGKAKEGGFAMIATKNPFVEEGLEPIVFEKMSEEIIDHYIENSLVPQDWKNYTGSTYSFNYRDISLFIKKDERPNNWANLLAKNIKTKASFSIFQSGGESSSNAPLTVKGEKLSDDHSSFYGTNYQYQYIGKLFRNKPPVAFGFMFHSFGCPIIDFLDEEELPVSTLCDNRH